MSKRCTASRPISTTTSKQKFAFDLSSHEGWSLASRCALAFQGHASRGRLRNQSPALIRDFTLEVTNRAAPSHHSALSSKLSLPHGAEEIDLQFDGGEGFAGRKCACKRHSHRCVSNIAKNSSMDRRHGIRMPFSGCQRDDRASIANFLRFKPD